MTNIAGVEVPLPEVHITGFLSSSWIYILIVGVIGFLLIVSVALILFFRTYNRRIILFENVSGLGFQPSLKTRARVVRLGVGGEEVLKTLAGGHYITAYGRKMGKNTLWFCKARDGYWYNVVLGDIDTKLNMLDIEPVDRDVRMFHVALDRLSHQTYGKQSFLQKYGIHMLLFAFLIVLILGMWFIIGKVGTATSSLAATAETNKEVAELLSDILRGAANIKSTGVSAISSGIVPAG
ncbi:MAG: hypothetical protein ACTSYG_10880 [Candidatus Heimdallarchaeota archaeon]